MAYDDTLTGDNGITGALAPHDIGAQGSVYDEYLRKMQQNQPDETAYASALASSPSVTPEAPTAGRQSSFETYDPDPPA